MIRRWMAVALLASSSIAVAELVEGPGSTASNPLTECKLAWDYALIDEREIDGFEFEIDTRKSHKVAKTLREINCRRLSMESGMHSVRLYAYRGDARSDPSNSLEFYYSRTIARTNYSTDPALVPPVIHITTPNPPAI